MKQTKNKLVYFIAIVIGIFLYSCQKEEIKFEVKQNTTSKYISIKDLIDEKLVFNKLQEIKIKTEQVYSKSNGLNEKYNFILNTHKILFTQINDLKCYTLPIYRPNNNEYVENLVLKLNQKGNCEVFGVKYYLNKDEREKLDKGEKVNFQGKYQIFPFENYSLNNNQNKGTTPTKCYKWVRKETFYTELGANEFATWIMVEVPCSTETSDCTSCTTDAQYNYPETYNWDLTWSSQINSSTNANTSGSIELSGSAIATAPVFEFPNPNDDTQAVNFYNTLSSLMKSWVVLNANEYYQLINYQLNDNWSPVTRVNSIAIIDYLSNHNYQTNAVFQYLDNNNYNDFSINRVKSFITTINSFLTFYGTNNGNAQRYTDWAANYFFTENPNITWQQFLPFFNDSKILNYLIQSNFSQDSQEFINELISYLIANPSVNAILKDLIDLKIELNVNPIEILNTIQDYRGMMSDQEKSIFDTLSKITQIRYLGCGKKAFDTAIQLFPVSVIPSNLHNGKGDAFRHAYWNGLSSFYIGRDLTEQLTNAHENRPQTYTYEYKEVQMDLNNNYEGRRIADYSTVFNLKDNILSQMILGNLYYLNNLGPAPDFYATYSSQLIRTNQ